MTLEQQLRIAEGYAELGMHQEALAELDKLSSRVEDYPAILRMRVAIVLQLREWATALRLSRRLCELLPNESYGFIHAAFCLHELGRTLEAKEMLLNGPASLLDQPVYYYNLGCYEAVLGNLEQAKAYLRASFRLNKAFQDIAKNDADLTALRDSL
jgi:predicted Zn-dependent protease